jgi:chemotaxis methyl-accepting protein methylase
MEDRQFLLILDFFGLSWKGYRKVRRGVKRRLDRYMQELGIRDVEALRLALQNNPEQRREIEQLLTVFISRFFRDRALWKALEQHILPPILTEPESVKVWSAGCAGGEEVYSLKILWEELGRKRPPIPQLEIWATDVHPDALARAQEGVYSASSLKEVPEDWRARYFRPLKENRWAVADFLKEGIRWRIHNLLTDAPLSRGFRILFLRNNLLTYYREEIAGISMNTALENVSPGGLLVVGAHETLPVGHAALLPSPVHPAIFQKPGLPQDTQFQSV